jgi:hypothetical protein
MNLRTAPIPRYSWLSRRHSLVLTVLFACLLALPVFGWLFDVQGVKLHENRTLTAPPDFRRTPLTDLPGRIEAYYDDRIGFRGVIIRGSAIFFYQFLKEPLQETAREVLIGKSPAQGRPSWYFYTSEGVLEDMLGLGLLLPEQLERWKKSLERRSAWLHSRGVEYLFVVPPEKSTVYPELLPNYLQPHAGAATRFDQLTQYLKRTNSQVAFLDLRSAMWQAKPEGELFFPYDSHWNGRAAFHAYQEIVKALQRDYPDLAPGTIGRDFEIRPGPVSLRTDLASMLGLSPVSPTPLLDFSRTLPESNWPRFAPAQWPRDVDASLNGLAAPRFYALETPGRRRRILVFHDSFFVSPIFSEVSQPLAMHFARSYFAWLRPSDEAFERFVELERPDLVVEERAERLLRDVPLPPAPRDPVTPHLRRSAGAPAFSIDRINNARAKKNETIHASGELKIEGWAFDEESGQLASGVEIMIDGVFHAAGYGLDRPDLSDLSLCGPCVRAGFRSDFSAIGLAPGPHTIAIRVISADGASYKEAIWGRINIAL